MTQQPICLFDSGIGGLTVLKKLIQKFPNENYIYLADLARVPFGDRTKGEIKNIAGELIDWLLQFKPKLIIMACNTSSAVLSSHLPSLISHLPIYGMIESCAKEIASSNYKKVSVWATKLVVENNGYKNSIQKLNPNITVEEIACPKLVPMIEDLNFKFSDKQKIIKEYIEVISSDTQALVLGCTHYPHIQDSIRALTKTEIIDPADSLMKDLENHLSKSKVSWSFSRNNKHQVSLYTTAQSEKVQKFSKVYLEEEFKVRQVTLKKVAV